MKILGIETSCDETGVAVVKDGRKILSNVISSSVELHQKYGGVVPEIAAREQVKIIIPATEQALSEAKVTLAQIDAVAVTSGPGLIGSLLVGTETTKTLGLVLGKPLIPINHLIGHIYANWLTPVHGIEFIDRRKENSSMNYGLRTPNFPLVALIVSGGHTDLVLMKNHGEFKLLGGTRDDAAGEAFDKVARVLGLGYPGGPEIERVARSHLRGETGRHLKGTHVHLQDTFGLPRPMINSNNFDFSFSGLKTAVVNLVHNHLRGGVAPAAHLGGVIAYEFQEAVVDVLVTKTIKAAKKYQVKQILIGGGVAANLALRSQLFAVSKKLGISVNFPNTELCIDNGAMIAAAAFYNFKPAPFEKIQAQPGLHF